jgi:steroid delta-isomerase
MAELSASINDTIQRYVKAFNDGDRAAWLGCFAPDATMEDPVGTPLKHGADEIGAFFDQNQDMVDELEVTIPRDPIVCGSEASFVFDLVVSVGGAKLSMSVIDVMTFDGEARITSQRAFVDMTKLAPL